MLIRFKILFCTHGLDANNVDNDMHGSSSPFGGWGENQTKPTLNVHTN